MGVLAFVSVCAFIGITLWLGLSVESEDNKTVIKNNYFNEEKIPSTARTEQQVVLGAPRQQGAEDIQPEGSGGKHLRKKQYDEAEVASATELVYKDVGEEAYIEEVHKSQIASEKENIPTGTAAVHRKEVLTSGSPLYPQPITETPDEATVGETATPKPAPETVTTGRQQFSEHDSTPQTLPFSSTGVTTIKESDLEQQMSSKPEHATDDLLNSTEEDRPLSSEEDIASAFIHKAHKDIRHFDISDAVNAKGEHFMPQNFDYPHDRDYVPSQHFDNLHVTESSFREHGHEITEDGVDRDGVPSLDHDDGLFYSPSNPDRYDGEDPDLAENPFTTFLQGRLQELYNWLSTDEDLAGKHNADSGTLNGDFVKILVALNRSLNEGNSSILLGQLKEMYYNESTPNVTDPAVLHNSSNLVSFGLLAFDLLLLRNVQQIAWEEEKLSSEEMLKDPEVLALNALFMPPEKVRELQVGRQAGVCFVTRKHLFVSGVLLCPSLLYLQFSHRTSRFGA